MCAQKIQMQFVADSTSITRYTVKYHTAVSLNRLIDLIDGSKPVGERFAEKSDSVKNVSHLNRVGFRSQF